MRWLAAAEAVASVTALAPGDRTLCMLPLAALPARVLDVYAALVTGATVHVPESPASVPIDLVEVAPTVLSASPRALELLRASVQVRAARSHGFKRRLQRWAREHPGAVAKVLVAKPAARLLGLGSTRVIVCVGGPADRRDARLLPRARARRCRCSRAARARAGLVLYDGKPLPGVTADVRDGRLVACAPWSGRVIDGAVTELLAREEFGRSSAAPATSPAKPSCRRWRRSCATARTSRRPRWCRARVGWWRTSGSTSTPRACGPRRNGVHAPTPRALAAERRPAARA